VTSLNSVTTKSSLGANIWYVQLAHISVLKHMNHIFLWMLNILGQWFS